MTPTKRAKRRTIYETLAKLAEAQHRTKSEILTDAIQAYARRFNEFI